MANVTVIKYKRKEKIKTMNKQQKLQSHPVVRAIERSMY